VSSLVLIPAVYLAGILSFLSPCTLPVLPAYFAFQARQSRLLVTSMAFFLGLATTLTLLGATATTFGLLIAPNLRAITVVGGIAIMVFGFMSLVGRGFSGFRLHSTKADGPWSAYLFGATFALGWSACVGPILGAVLTLLATQGAGVLQGSLLTVVYAMGVATPLVVIALWWNRFGAGTRAWRALRGRAFELRIGRVALHLHSTEIASGVLLMAMGYVLATGQLASFGQAALGSPLSRWVLEIEDGLRRLFGLR
jgi:cytochrome c-type biogenesis protein